MDQRFYHAGYRTVVTQSLIEKFVAMFHKFGVQTSARDIYELGFRVWVEGFTADECWIYRSGQQVSMRHFAVEVTAEGFKQNFIKGLNEVTCQSSN